MLNDESFGFEKHVSQGDHEGNLEAADEDGFQSDQEFVADLGRVVDDPDPRKEIAVDEAKKGDNKDERTKKPDEAKSGKDAERKKVQGGANNGRPVKLANLNRDAYFLNIIQSSFPCTDVGLSEPLPNHKPISSAEGKEVTLTK